MSVEWKELLSWLQLIIVPLVTLALREARLLAKEVRLLKMRQYKHVVYVAGKFGDPLPDYMEE